MARGEPRVDSPEQMEPAVKAAAVPAQHNPPAEAVDHQTVEPGEPVEDLELAEPVEQAQKHVHESDVGALAVVQP